MEDIYIRREGLLNKDFKINLEEFKEHFKDIYDHFGERGIWKEMYVGKKGNENCRARFTPSPKIYFETALYERNILPIESHYRDYSKKIIFSVIEILYRNMGEYVEEEELFPVNTKKWIYKEEEVKKEFKKYINNSLKLLDEGYWLSENGSILLLPNEPILGLISTETIEVIQNPSIIEKYKTAIEIYLKYDSSTEEKRKAIAVLADILEPLRSELKGIYASEEAQELISGGKSHDKLIFEIVNRFGIRHNGTNQQNDYSTDIWFDWMFHYYCSAIITYYRLKINEIS